MARKATKKGKKFQDAGKPLAAKTPGAQSLPSGIGRSLGRILRPQAAYRWLLPQLAAITPQYIELTLRGALAGNHVQAWELFDLMLDTWPELASCSQELIYAVQARKILIEPYHEEDEQPTPDAIERAKCVSAAIRQMRPVAQADENNLIGTVKDILSAWFLGQAVLEVEWTGKDGDTLNLLNYAGNLILAPRTTYWVHPVCYAWSMEGRMGLRLEMSPGAANTGRSLMPGVFTTTSSQPMPSQVSDFPEHKFLIAIQKAKSGTALGGAMLRPLAWWWCACNFSADWLLTLAEIWGLPFRWANYDPQAPQAVIDGVCSMLENMGSNGWAAFPAGTTLELEEATKTGDNSPQAGMLDRADRYARLLILGQTLSGNSGTGKGGGLAFGSVEGDVKAQRVDAAGEFACGVLRDQLASSILTLNFGDDDFTPTIRMLSEQEGTLQDAQRDTTLASGGLPIGINFLRKKYGIPAPSDGEETIGGGAPAVAPVITPAMQPADPNNPEDSADDSKPDLQARDAGAPPSNTKLISSGKNLVVEALMSEFEGINRRLAAAAAIDDPELQKTRLAGLMTDLDRFEKNLHADPAVANAIYKVMASAFANGLATNPKEA